MRISDGSSDVCSSDLFFVRRIAERCGFDAHRANRLEIAGDRLTGGVLEPILDKDAKLAALHHFTASRGLGATETMAVGDGANDLPMICGAGLGVAYRAKPQVPAQAPALVTPGHPPALPHIPGRRKSGLSGKR